MPDYTHMKFDDVPDMAKERPMPPGMEARFARSALGLQNSGVTLFRLAADFRLPFGHKHAEQEETYVLLKGTAKMRIEEDYLDLDAMDVVRVPPEVVRGLQAGPDGAEMLVFGAGPQGDGEMVKGWWDD